jgi:hypothetical protein
MKAHLFGQGKEEAVDMLEATLETKFFLRQN